MALTVRLAHLVWQNVNKLKGLHGKGIVRKRFWACIHMLMWEGAIEGNVGKHQRDMYWEGIAEEMRRLQTIGRGDIYVFDEFLEMRGSLGDSSEDSEEEP